MRQHRFLGCGFVLVVAMPVALLAPPAFANGAFPDSESILTPADRPEDILVVTNFGLITTKDGGGTWTWSCEQEGNAFGALYQLSPLPRRRLFTVTDKALAYSDDNACGWWSAGGALAGQQVTDAFVEPGATDTVLAIARAGTRESAFRSTDGGTTFGPALYASGDGESLNSIESAARDPRIVYLARRSVDGAPLLARSQDSGARWVTTDLSSQLGAGLLRIVAIDPQDPQRVWLRLQRVEDEVLALTTDGGATANKTIVVDGSFTAFVRLPTAGTVLVAANVQRATVPALFRSRDGGGTFNQLAGAPAIRALSQRDGVVYAATDNFGIGYALGQSHDEGDSWTAVMSYHDVQAISPCLKDRCQAICQAEVELALWSAAVCATSAGGSGGGATRDCPAGTICAAKQQRAGCEIGPGTRCSIGAIACAILAMLCALVRQRFPTS